MSMKITLMPGAYEGNCIECGKHFIRRQIDSFDDGALCFRHYKERQKEQVSLCFRHYKEWQKEQVSGGECKAVASVKEKKGLNNDSYNHNDKYGNFECWND